MTLQQLEYIVALDTHRHFVKAADSCFVTQPTLTLQIKKLENEMGAAIFDRSKHPITPTKMGYEIIEKARMVLREVNGLKDFVNAEKDSLKGFYRLGVIPTIAPFLMFRFLKDFTQNNPDITLKIRELESEQIISDIKNDKLDIGILATPLEEGHLKEIPLYNEPFLLYTSELHPLYRAKKITTHQLPEKGLWLLNQGHCLRNQVLSLCDKKGNTSLENLQYESGSIQTLMNLVKNHSGYTLVPELSVIEEQNDPHIRRFESPVPVREISLVTHRSFAQEAVTDALKTSILDNLPKHFSKVKKINRLKWR